MATSRPPPSQRLNPLATAKGQKLLCELTGKPASIVVNYFGVPYYYCDRTTLELDWNGIKQKIAQLLVPLRQPPSVIPSVEERERQEANVRKSKLALIDLCRMEATKFLVHGDFELSIPGAVQALRYSLDVYGAGKIELVPCYLLLAEANLGLGRHKQAEEYLSLANWSILKNPDCSNRTKSQLYRNFGKLYASQGKHDEALRQLANDVYFSSLQVGPEHIETAGGYYYIATVFYLQRRIDCALAMCDKVVDIWLKHVSGLIDPSKVDGTEEVEPLGESQLMDGLQTLTKIVALREESMGADHITTGEALYTVSLVYVYAKDNQRAIQLMEKAYNIYYWELGPDSKRTQELAESIRLAGGVPQAPTGERPSRKAPTADIAEVRIPPHAQLARGGGREEALAAPAYVRGACSRAGT
jgi:tetratricopeptide (TPR) repeat protein